MALLGKTSERLKRMRTRSSGFAGAVGDSAAGGASGALQNGPMPGFPGSRELRAQAVHRLQVGIFGLATMLLLVSLASVIMQRVKTADRSAVAAAPNGAASASPANDPLVDLGVAPEVPVGGNAPAHKPAKPESAH
jgi:hypothetical protein